MLGGNTASTATVIPVINTVCEWIDPTKTERRGQKHHGSLANYSHAVLTSNDRYCHQADGVFDYYILLASAICPSSLQK
jgi:hypothetical protein